MNKSAIRIVVSLLVILLFIFGCQNAEYKDLKAKADIEAQNIDLVTQAWSEWNNHNMEFFSDFYDQTNYKYYEPINNPNPKTFEGVKESMENAWKNFPDITLKIEQIMAVDDKVISMILFSGTHSENIDGFPPATGEKIEISVINVLRFQDGKAVEEWENIDIMGFYKQLGMELKPKE